MLNSKATRYTLLGFQLAHNIYTRAEVLAKAVPEVCTAGDEEMVTNLIDKGYNLAVNSMIRPDEQCFLHSGTFGEVAKFTLEPPDNIKIRYDGKLYHLRSNFEEDWIIWRGGRIAAWIPGTSML